MSFRIVIISVIVLWLCSCKQQPKQAVPNTIRLVDIHKAEFVQNTSKSTIIPERTEWKFDSSDKETSGWQAASQVTALQVRNGKLVGRSSGVMPMLVAERKVSPNDNDLLHSIEIRMKASGSGLNVAVSFAADDKLNLDRTKELIESLPSFAERSPLLSGDQIQAYILKPSLPVTGAQIRHVIFIPVDKPNVEFEVESIRLIFRKEYLATVASGVSWQGLKGIFQETIVTRSPESIVLDTPYATNSWLDVNLGTIEDDPVTFRVYVKSNDSENVLFERTITRPHRWEHAAIELPGSNPGSLVLSLHSEQPGKIGFWGAPAIRKHAAASQSVIVIWTDTLRRDHLDVYGYKRATAPHLKALANEGALFQNAISQATWTKVASPTLVTSLYPATHGVRDFTDRLPSSATTMAELFQKAGYATIGFSSNLFTATFSNFHQGFEQLHEDSSLPNPSFSKTTREYMDRLLPWIDAHSDVPFFVFLHAYDPHDPYEPYPPYDTMWADPKNKAEFEQKLEDARKVITDPLMKLFGMPTREEMLQAKIDPEWFAQQSKDWYDGSIRGMDAEIGRLIERIRSCKMDKRTLIVLAGDHGEEFLEHGRMFHGQSVYGELTNVPLMFWGPGLIPPGKKITQTVETVDVMPTILELTGLKAPSGIQGQSFASLFKKDSGSGEAKAGPGYGNNRAFSEKAITSTPDAPAPHDTESFSIVGGNWKLIHNTKRHEGTPEYELFDLRTDYSDQINLADKHPEIVKELGKIIQQWNVKASSSKLKPDTQATQGLSQEELERLRALGYIQ